MLNSSQKKTRLLSLLLSLVLLVSVLAPVASAVDLYVDACQVETDTEPVIVSGRTLVPVRAIFEALGASVEWDASTSTVTAIKDDTTILIQIDNPIAYVNDQAYDLDVPAQIMNSRTMVPARFVAEALNAVVYWDQENYCVQIFTDQELAEAYAQKEAETAAASTTVPATQQTQETQQTQQTQTTQSTQQTQPSTGNSSASSATSSSATTSSSGAASSSSTEKKESSSSSFSDSSTVYVSKSGKIHKRSNCSGMKSYSTMTYGQAKSKGYTNCKNCF